MEHPSPVTLRPYQQEALAALEASPHHRHILALATGLGKTIVFCAFIARRLTYGRALIIVHTDELVSQALDKLHLMLPGVPIGIVKADHNDLDAPVIIASRQTLARPTRLCQLPTDVKTLVIDEAHHSLRTNSYGAIMHHLGAFEANGLVTVGATATPFRADREDLADVYEGITYKKDVLWGIKNDFLCDVRGIRIALDVDLAQVHTRGGDFIDAELAAELATAHAPENIVSGYLEHAKGRKALAYLPSVKLAEETAEAFLAAGVPAAVVSGQTPVAERRAAITALRHGELRVLSSCSIFVEGFDEPSADCILMARPTKSRLLYVQIIGRGLRPFFQKENLLVLDFVGASGRHQLVTLDDMMGLRLRKRSVLQAIQEDEEAQRARTARQEEARRRAEEEKARVGALAARRVEMFERAATHWAAARDFYAVAIKDGQIAVEPVEGGYLPLLLTERGHNVQALATQPLPLDYAHAVAEDWIARNRPEERFLSAKDAHWRARPPTEKAVAFGAKWGLEPEPGETAGAFSDRISLKIAQVNLRAYHRRGAGPSR